ncbi:MAG TPA: addiction module protein [Blastocatellia bacterium]|nr:addiction module protein [Blastocatellia bacterium]
MTETASQILAQALTLSSEERAELADRLLESIHKIDPHLAELWVQEAEDRMAAFDRGEMETVSLEEVFDKINRQRSNGK